MDDYINDVIIGFVFAELSAIQLVKDHPTTHNIRQLEWVRKEKKAWVALTW